MIRSAEPADTEAVVELVVAAEMFSAEEAVIVRQMMAEYFAGGVDEGHHCLVDVEDGLLAVAYYQPKPAADRVWDLTMIAVRPESQGQGLGTALLRQVEHELRELEQRLLLVDTSGTEQYDRTREFDVRCDYDEEARVRDYWESGDDLVVFRKAL